MSHPGDAGTKVTAPPQYTHTVSCEFGSQKELKDKQQMTIHFLIIPETQPGRLWEDRGNQNSFVFFMKCWGKYSLKGESAP